MMYVAYQASLNSLSLDTVAVSDDELLEDAEEDDELEL